MLYRQRGADWAKIAGSTYKASSLKPVKDNQSQSQATRRLTKTQALERIFLSVFIFYVESVSDKLINSPC